MNSSDRLRPEDLLGHVEWAKALARRLVRDDSTADDVAQEALAVALERPPTTDRPVRPWLGRVLQNTVRQRARGERRRDRREHAAAPKEALPSVHELTERAEAQGLLVEALLGLDGATRRVVLLRYFEGHSAAEIARALGEPAGTVRSRLSRGLAQLRERLDERFGGDRSAWHAALAPLVSLRAAPVAGFSLAALLALPLAMKLFTAVALLAALCLAVLMVGGPGVLPGGGPAIERVTFTAMEPLVLVSDTLAAPGGRASVASPTAEPAAPADLDVASVAIDLRFVDEQGAPIEGVQTRLWGGLRKVSDLDGRVRYAVKAGAHSNAQIRATRAGFVSDEVELGFPESGTRDAGDIVLLRGGAIEGVVLVNGAPARDVTVRVQGREVETAASGGMRMSHVSGLGAANASTDEEGRFRLDGLLPGECRVEVESDDDLIEGISGRVEVRVGQVSTGLLIEANEVPVNRRIEGSVTDSFGNPVPYVGVRYEWGSWLGSGSGSGSTDEHGRFRIVLDKKRTVDLSTWGNAKGEGGEASIDGVASGTLDVELRLEAARTLSVRVVTPDGEAVEGRLIAATSDTNDTVFNGILGQGAVDVTVPRDAFRVIARVDRFREVKSPRLKPGALPDSIELVLEPQAPVAGRVLGGDVGAEGAMITVRAMASSRARVAGIRTLVDPFVVATAEAGADGAFDFMIRRSGTYMVRAELPGRAAAEFGPVKLKPGAPPEPFTIRLTDGGSIQGRIEDADTLQQTRVVLASRGDGLARTVRTAPDGTFRFDHLTPGPWRVQVTDREVKEGMSDSSSSIGFAYGDVDGNCVVYEGRTTWFDLAAGKALVGATVEGQLTVRGLDPGSLSVHLVPESPTGGAEPLASRAKLDDQGRFVVQSAATGAHALRIEGEPTAGDPEPLRLFWPLDLAAGPQPFAAELDFCTVTAGPTANRTLHRLVWRGESGAFGVAPVPREGESGLFPAGTVSLVPAAALDFGGPADVKALESVDAVLGEAVTLGR